MRIDLGMIASCAVLAIVLPSCSAVSDNSYYAVRAVVATGPNGTDGNVSLCFTANGAQQCHDLSSGNNDFESGTRQTFDVSLQRRVAHGTSFTGVSLKYTTGLSIGDTWEPTELRVSRYFGNGSEEVLCDAMFDQSLSDGATFVPPGCP